MSISLGDIQKCIAFWPFGTLIELDVEIWDRLCQAALHQNVVILDHKRGNSSAWNERRFAPYTVFEHKDAWYVCGRDIKSAKEKCFSLSRVRNVRQTKEPFERPEDFSLAGFLADTFGVYRGTGDYLVRIEFDHFAAEYVRLRRWHRSQKLTDGENGSVIVELLGQSYRGAEMGVVLGASRPRTGARRPHHQAAAGLAYVHCQASA